MAIIECIPNISEGRRSGVVAAIAAAVGAVRGVQVLDVSSDASHNRTVLTLAGEGEAVQTAVLALFDAAIAAIDMRTHRGVHPRLGAVDVVPFVPLAGASMAHCVALATATAAAVAERFHVPVYLYERAATRPSRQRLEDVRRGGFEGLVSRLADPAWRPDFGPSAPHPTAGATVIGARPPLIAYNVNLATDRLDVAKRVAAAVRSSSGGLPCVKAMGVRLADRGIVQVSMNLTDYDETPVYQVFEAVTREAARDGVEVLESEIVGLIPEAALLDSARLALRLPGHATGQTLEGRLRASAADGD